MAYGVGEAAVAALIIAAVAASAVTATKAATGQYDSAGEGVEDWFKSYLISAGAGVAGGYVGSVVQGATAAGQTGAAAAEGAQAATQAGVAAGEAAQVGANIPAAVTTLDSGAEVATTVPEAMQSAEMLAANSTMPLSETAFAANPAVGLSAANTTGQTAPSFFEQLQNFNVAKELYSKLGNPENTEEVFSAVEQYQPYAKALDTGLTGYQNQLDQQQLAQQQQNDYFARFIASPAFNAQGKQGSYAGFQQSEFDKQQAANMLGVKEPEQNGGFMGSSSWLDY